MPLSHNPSTPDDLIRIWPHLQPRELTPSLKAEADDAVRGRVWFRFDGEHVIEVGRRDIDWSGAHRKHHEWPAQLNRFYTLRALAAAWHHGRDEQYAQAARDYLEDWMKARPTRTGWAMGSGDNTLSLAIRIGNSRFPGWSGAIAAFSGSESFDQSLVTRLLDSIAAQLDFLMGNLTTANNWRIAQADTLVATAVRFPELPNASNWRKRGIEIINEAAREQFLPDGAHIERTPGYHWWMAAVLHHYWTLGRALPELGLDIETARVERAYTYSLASLRPHGQSNRLHDSPADHRAAPIIQDYQAFLREAGREAPREPARYFPWAGQALLRDGSGSDAGYVTFDATPFSGLHWHPGINSVQVDVKGRPLLVDPGILDYERSNPLMAYGKSTRAHNTVNFNGWNQAPVEQVQTKYFHAPGLDFVSSRYEGGYWPVECEWGYRGAVRNGIWARHHRRMLWLHGDFMLVVDDVAQWPGDENEVPSVECNWQFERGPVEVDFERDEAVTGNADANLLLRVLVKPENTRLHRYEGETEPPRGWTAGEDRVGPAPQVSVCCDKLAWHGARFVTLIVPFEGPTPPVIQSEIIELGRSRVLKLALDDETVWLFLDGVPFEFSEEEVHFSGSAGVLRCADGRAHCWLAEGSRLSAEGMTLEATVLSTD
jgi:hypothetical protein